MRKQLLLPLTRAKNFKAESTIGLTEASASLDRFHQLDSLKDPGVQMFLRNRDNQIRQQQLADIFLSQQAAEEKDEDHSSLAHHEKAGFHQSITEVLTEYECYGCGRMTSRRCGKCRRDFFCSESCEAKRSPRHAFQCKLGRPLTTADYLLLDVVADKMPEDPDVLSDFGFKNLMTPDRSKLMGLYQGLEYLGISAEELHEWQQSGCLVDRIQRTYLKIPERSRGGYFPWFMENHHEIFRSQSEQRSSGKDLLQKYLDNVSIHLEPQDRGKPLEQFEPQSKRDALLFFAILAQQCRPNPSFAMYLDFGFCVCHNSNMEQNLAVLYQHLLFGTTLHEEWTSGMEMELNLSSSPPLRTFMEFWRAFDESRLINLMDDRGLKSKREEFPHLDSVLSRKAGEPLPHVWILQTFLNDDNATVAPDCILFQYGFIGCANSVDLTELKDFYQEVLMHADALELEKASKEQRLLTFAKSYIDVSGKVTKILEKSFQLSLSSIN
ncbi:uncharacterized protein LTHEOB_4525 [Lasiodiplodia theobromae]|uniref:uncharacterized protein n=1 Tax=Lasiodiplodia theobromae TaxID=45133 RepID=UPI0015C2F9AE|nr:uncharacterized protein LTHEOB_4525 [Lasiodiplodia theobromae]KAF4545873.1 hypothetical protein LTHEOB_4525 [Lasiodiplodia theobromae]